MAYETFKNELRNAFPLYNDELDIDFLLELLYFFPIDKTYISTGSYDQYLYDLEKTVVNNYESGNYQVSFFYAHLIFMSYVYYCVEKAYEIEPERMKDVYYPLSAYRSQNEKGKKLTKPDLDNYDSIYDFSRIPEKDIFKVFRVMGMDDAEVRAFAMYINNRDDYAHATGKGNIAEGTYRQNIKIIIGNMNSLHKLFLPALEKYYLDFITNFLETEYEVLADNFSNFIFDYSISISDLKHLSCMGVGKLQTRRKRLKEQYQSTRNIHCAFIEYCVENDGIDPPEGYNALRNEKYLFFRYKDHANDYVENELHISKYECVKDGGVFPVYECPDCGAEQLVFNAEHNKFHCFACDEDHGGDAFDFCSVCGRVMYSNGSEICNDCFEYKMEKD